MEKHAVIDIIHGGHGRDEENPAMLIHLRSNKVEFDTCRGWNDPGSLEGPHPLLGPMLTFEDMARAESSFKKAANLVLSRLPLINARRVLFEGFEGGESLSFMMTAWSERKEWDRLLEPDDHEDFIFHLRVHFRNHGWSVELNETHKS